MIKISLIVPKNISGICVILFIGLMFISCGQPGNSDVNAQPVELRAVDKQTLSSMVKQLHRGLNVKDYTVDKGMRVLKPYLSRYKVCIPGFSKTVPYNESYLYVYCIYDTRQTPLRLLSFRFELPKHLAQQLTIEDISRPFKAWQLEYTLNKTDSTTTNKYNAGGQNLSINVTQQVRPNQTDSIVTEVIVYH